MKKYKERVKLLVKILSYIFEEKCFALKGGTAINLFYFDFPRLSVDIDLTYIHINDRKTAYKEINKSLQRIKSKLDKDKFKTELKSIPSEQKKLYCFLDREVYVKIEPNYNSRGFCLPIKQIPLTDKAQDILEEFVLMNILSFGEVFGEKICAALDRQHPRDLFDCKNLLEKQGINEEVKKGFLSSLLSSKRPLHEILNPNLQNREKLLEEEFVGMTNHDPEYIFNYKNHTETFYKLVEEIHKSLTQQDKQFLLDFVKLKHKWQDVEIKNIEKLPAIQWKIKNLKNLKESDIKKFEEQYNLLKEILD
jgi:predicted nucleotidyltransferase component of viral defense system